VQIHRPPADEAQRSPRSSGRSLKIHRPPADEAQRSPRSSGRSLKIRQDIRKRARRWVLVLTLVPQAGWRVATAAVLLNLAIGSLPVAFIVATGVVLTQVPAADGSPAADSSSALLVLALAIAVGAFVLQQVLVPFQTACGELLARRIDGSCVERLMRAACAAPLAGLERADALDTLSDARSAFNRVSPTPGEAAAGAIALVARYTQMIGAVAMLAVVVSPVVGAVAGLTALIVRFGSRGSLGRFSDLWTSLAGPRRKVNYVRALAGGERAAKEIRVLGLLPWLQALHAAATRGYLRPIWMARRRILGRPFLGYAAVALAGSGVAFGWLAAAAGHGLSLLALSLGIQAILIPIRFGVFFPESDVQTQYGIQAYQSMLDFEQRAGSAAPTGPGREVAPCRSIRFENVTFAYAQGQRDVLRGLDLTIPIGRSTAIVGLNGAGKTTLVKLLTRLYEPTAGRITVDGVDLSHVDPRAWHRQFAVIFQDYVRYELSVADNIGLGRPERLGDAAALHAATERAGATDLVHRLPAGLDTPLSPRYEGGSDLSGGEWQRVATARAYFAVQGGASILVLDEPTAQLDVRAEVEFFDRFLDLTAGLTTVLVSHRFSTVRRADAIVVLADGRVVEQGTHEELVARDGRYAELFRLQAERFSLAGAPS
jgi:ATP-binding cassette, subfamily B, bacterial